MKVFLLIASVFLLSQVNAQSQQKSVIDSLLDKVRMANEDTVKVKLYTKISYWYMDYDISKAMLYADSVSLMAKKINQKEGIAVSLANYGDIYNFKGEYSKAIAYFTKAYEISKEIKSARGMAGNLYSLGSANERMSNYTDAAGYYFQSLRIHESIPGNEQAVAGCLGGIAVIYFLQKDYEKSLEYSIKVIKIQQAIKNEVGLANEYINVADTYYRLSDSVNASKYNNLALALTKKLGLPFQEGIVYSQLGVLNSKNPEISLGYLFKAQKKLEAISPVFSSTILNRGEIGKAFLKLYKMGKKMPVLEDNTDVITRPEDILQKAQLYLQNAVNESRVTGDKDKEAMFSADLAEAQFLNGKFKDAYRNLNSSYVLHDSLYSQDNKNKIAALESQKKVDLKDKEIQINKLAITSQRKTQIGLIAGLCLLGIIGGLLFRQNYTRKKTNAALLHLNTELEEANKVKARLFGILSHDLRSPIANLVSFLHLQKESPGLFTAEQLNANQKRISNSAESLLESMEAMLFWSKEQMENFRPQIKSIPVSDLFDYIENFFSQTEQVVIKYNFEKGLTVTADQNYLQVIMQNLTSNAIKALKDRSGAIIEWNAVKQGENTLLSITDNGPGISEDNVKTLLGEGDNITINAKTGFGLHLVKDLAKAMNYRISIHAQPESGTTFTLSEMQGL